MKGFSRDGLAGRSLGGARLQLAGSELDECLVLLALRCKSSQKHFSAFIRHTYTFVASWYGVFTAATDICNWAEKNDRVNHQTLLAEKAYFLFVFFRVLRQARGGMHGWV